MQIAIDSSLDIPATEKPHTITVHPQDYLDAVMILRATVYVSPILTQHGQALASYARSSQDTREIVIDPSQAPEYMELQRWIDRQDPRRKAAGCALVSLDNEAFTASLAQAPAIVRPRLEALRDAYQQGYEEITACWPVIATRIESSGIDHSYPWMPTIRSFAPPVQVVENKQYQHAVRVKVEHLFSGEIAEYLLPLRRAGAYAKRLPDQLLAALIVENPPGFDGVPFFGPHRFEVDDPARIYGNDAGHAGEGQNWIPGSLIYGHAQGMENAYPGVKPVALVVGANLEQAAVTGAINCLNWNGRQLAVAVLPDLPADHPYWYLIARVGDTLPFIWQERTAAAFMIFDQHNWTCDMGPIVRGAVATTFPFLALRVRA